MQTPIGSTFDAFARHGSSINAFSARHSVDIPSSSLGTQPFSGNFVQYTSGQQYSTFASDDIYLPSHYTATRDPSSVAPDLNINPAVAEGEGTSGDRRPYRIRRPHERRGRPCGTEGHLGHH